MIVNDELQGGEGGEKLDIPVYDRPTAVVKVAHDDTTFMALPSM